MVESFLDVVLRVDGRDEVARDDLGALVDQLVEGVLAVRPGLAPHDRASGVVHRLAGAGDVSGEISELKCESFSRYHYCFTELSVKSSLITLFQNKFLSRTLQE